ncbi:MAG TPA: alpha/beta hydrolase [Vicinamibacterales bacterium]|nr:alpha/beta hydrolase [Vicinamibacterales bacterium]
MQNAFTRRQLLLGLAALGPAAMAPTAQAGARTQSLPATSAAAEPLGQDVLPRGVRARFVNNVNGIRMHVLEAGFEGDRRPAVLLVHGFPELAYSWRKVMPAIAAAGYHVIAPDLRGYGRSDGTDVTFDDDLSPWRTLNEVTDMVALVTAFGYRTVAAVVGHDFGSPVAAWCSVVRPDVFRSVVLMSAPFAGPPSLPFDTVDASAGPAAPADRIYDDLAHLTPPRKHYQRYYSTREANDNMRKAPQGLHAFLRAYYHMKSADWKQNQPHQLAARSAEEWAKLPRYYVMDLSKGMAETVAPEMPSAAAIAACKWLPEEELRVYSGEYGRTGFQGGLQSYRIGSTPRFGAELQLFSGRTIDQPSLFIAGKSDWGAFQNPGALERMQKSACTRMSGATFVDGAGHWVQQEQPEQVSRLIVDFLRAKR